MMAIEIAVVLTAVLKGRKRRTAFNLKKLLSANAFPYF